MLIAAAATAGGTLAATHGSVVHIGANSHRPCSIGLRGDVPYSTEQATVGMPNLIADINRQQLAFTVQRRRSGGRLRRLPQRGTPRRCCSSGR